MSTRDYILNENDISSPFEDLLRQANGASWMQKFLRDAEYIKRVKKDPVGPANKCERNTFSYLEKDEKYLPVVGYAHEPAGWFWHMWVYDSEKDQHIETCRLDNDVSGDRIGRILERPIGNRITWMDLSKQGQNAGALFV